MIFTKQIYYLMRNVLIYILLLLVNNSLCSLKNNKEMISIETNLGTIKVKLYDETPLHRDNFKKLIQEGVYDGVLFHRVIKDFMIQAGDPDSRNASDSAFLGKGDLGYTVEPEFCTPKIFHKKGALAAARMGDDVNPQKASSASQFYIVTGEIFGEGELHAIEKQRIERLKQEIFKNLQSENMDKIKELYKQGDRTALATFKDSLIELTTQEAEKRKDEVLFSPEQIQTYTTVGGAPHLDGGYTVFGEVVEGWDVINAIENTPTNRDDRPLKNVIIKKITIE